jgi:hypothetical protein
MTDKLTWELLEEVNRYTSYTHEVINRARTYVAVIENGEPPELKKQRLQARECLCCFYLRGGRISGQAITNWECRICKKEDVHSDTGVPHYCKDCSELYELCTECGGTLDNKMRRTDKPRK